jgi:hypothetical protein
MTGIAHVSFSGGGIFLPARNPYDRQMLMEHIADRVRMKGQVQVLLDNQRWIVHRRRGPLSVCCAGCGESVDSACYSSASGDVGFCVRCAFGDIVEPVLSQRHEARRVG